MKEYFWLIPFFPAIGAAVFIVFNRVIPRKLVSWLGPSLVGLSFITAFASLLQFLGSGDERWVKVLFTWIDVGSLKVPVSFQFDPLSAVMAVTVAGVAFLIHVYSIGYMADDWGYVRYFAYLNLFTFSMLLLVMAANVVLMFIGWEGVGLCSYLLIGFWFEKDSAANAGKKAFIVNRVGDFGFLLGIFLLFTLFGDLSFTHINANVNNISQGLATAAALLLFLGATGKSAQIPLYVWLPDAMEGPTPVSALIHAATMVTAGVYMVARLYPLYARSGFAADLVAYVGIITAFFAATIALVQTDIKRVLAYSTISQIGYMFAGVGVGVAAAGMFHLFTHAFFKSLLFLAAGSVIHGLGEQDLRKMGGLRKVMPWTFAFFLVAALAIAGVPGLSGFFSKDEILKEAFLHGHKFVWALGVITAGMTAFYIFRLIFLAFYGEPRGWHHAHESPAVMLVPMGILAFFSITSGWIWEQFSSFLGYHPAHHVPLKTEIGLILISVSMALGGIFLAWLFYVKNPSLPRRLAERFSALYYLLVNKYFVDEIYNALIVHPFVNGSRFVRHYFDEAVVDGAVNGAAKLSDRSGGYLSRLQTGLVKDYGVWMLLGVIFALLTVLRSWR